MTTQEILDSVGIERKPDYWSEKYFKGIENLSKPIYEVEKEEDVVCYMRDGVKTYVDIYRPKNAEDEVFPGLVAFSAYGKSIQVSERVPMGFNSLLFDHTIEAGDVEYYVKRGYIVVIPDPRGVGKSEGIWDGLYGRQEQEDCYDVIEWTAKLKGCNGNIGMIGISYFSILQPLVAALQPPSLKAIMCVEIVDSLYHHNYPGGVFFDRSNIYNDFCPVKGISNTEKNNTEDELKALIDKRINDADVRSSALLTRVLSCFPPRHQTYFFDVIMNNLDNDFWDDRSLINKLKDIKIPMYLISEYYEFGRFTQGPFFAYNNCNDDVVTKIFAPEAHRDIGLPHKSLSEEYIRWYDYWLKGKETGVLDEPPIKIRVQGDERVRYEYEWPIERTQWTKFYLRKGGLLSKELESLDSVNPDIMNYTPPAINPSEPSEMACISYTTESMEEDMEITGPIALHLNAALDVDDANFAIYLFDVSEDGHMRLLTTGSLRASHRGIITEKTTDYNIFHNHTKKVPVTPNEVNRYSIEIITTSMVIKKGHKVKMLIKNTNPSYFSSMLITPDERDITYSIEVGKENPSYLLLPVIPYSPEEYWITKG
ncbi:MAG: CocE/NonD family hydrolase [Clostridiales bacterium]|nr:CocE/NonD family hydrolase [Clostridiales bacterium]